MRILVWSTLYPPDIGGIEVLMQQLVHELRLRGHEIMIITAQRPANPLPMLSFDRGIPVYRYDFTRVLWHRDPAQILAYCQQISAIKRSFQPDIIHMNTADHTLFFHERTVRAWVCPVLFTIHANGTFTSAANSLLGRMLRSADWLNTVSAALLQVLREAIPEVAERTSLVLNSLALPAPSPQAPQVDPPLLLCIGRVVADKGFDIALEAFALLRDEFPTTQLVVAGDGSALPGLKEQAQQLGLADRIQFPGWVDIAAVPELISRATLVLMPSRWDEPFGLVALQTAQMARPIVASNVGGIPEIVIHGETGLLVPREDATALAEAAATILRDPVLAARMGSAARARAAAKFSFERMVDEYEYLYRQLTASQPS